MTFREMTVEDLEQVVEIENRLFSDPWTKEGFFTFLTKENTMFFVIEEKEKILAYCSMQTVLDEGDILNVAVSPDRQREGIGYFLVDSMLKMAEMIGIHIVHLEVREGFNDENAGGKTYVGFMFAWKWRDDAPSETMADCADDKI